MRRDAGADVDPHQRKRERVAQLGRDRRLHDVAGRPDRADSRTSRSVRSRAAARSSRRERARSPMTSAPSAARTRGTAAETPSDRSSAGIRATTTPASTKAVAAPTINDRRRSPSKATRNSRTIATALAQLYACKAMIAATSPAPLTASVPIGNRSRHSQGRHDASARTNARPTGCTVPSGQARTHRLTMPVATRTTSTRRRRSVDIAQTLPGRRPAAHPPPA